MKNFFSSFFGQFFLVAITCFGFVILWSLPALIMGDGFGFPSHLEARNLAVTERFSFADSIGRTLSTDLVSTIGVPSAAGGRLSRIFMAFLSKIISWGDLVAWTIAGSATLAVGLFFWWATVARLFGNRVAWLVLIITGLMPVYFREAVWFDYYNLALALLALSAASYVYLKNKTPLLALLFAGLFFGAAIGAKDAFFTMMPWIGVTFLWKRMWKGAVVFFMTVFVVYLMPYTADIATLGYPVNQNLARLWPGAEAIANETYLHMYPDPYTYYFDKEEFDIHFKANAAQKPLVNRVRDEKVMIAYDLEGGIFRRVRLGMWLILHDVPSFFQRQTVGGVFLWIFAIPGFLALWKRDRQLVLWLVGLVVSMYILIRFVLSYEREHFMNIAWVFALLVGYGIAELSTMQKQMRANVAAGLIVAVCALQLLQANRYEFAARYRRSTVADLRGTAETLKSLPEGSVIAMEEHPSDIESLALLSDKTIALFRESTLEKLQASGELGNVLSEYGVTHALDYDMRTSAINISSEQSVSAPPSAFTKWLIHLIR